MTIIFGPSARAALIRLVCPSCGEIQARAREKKGTTYLCRKCGKPIEPDATAHKASPRKR